MPEPMPFPEPSSDPADPARLLDTYLRFYRSELARRLTALEPRAVRAAPLASGWSPLELAWHLVHAERRWVVWGFLGEPVDDPWSDEVDGRWSVPGGLGVADVLARLDEVARRTGAVLASTPLETPARTGGRFTSDPPTLGWIAFHLLQEHARHLGQLDVAVELLGGPTGEPGP